MRFMPMMTVCKLQTTTVPGSETDQHSFSLSSLNPNGLYQAPCQVAQNTHTQTHKHECWMYASGNAQTLRPKNLLIRANLHSPSKLCFSVCLSLSLKHTPHTLLQKHLAFLCMHTHKDPFDKTAIPNHIPPSALPDKITTVESQILPLQTQY